MEAFLYSIINTIMHNVYMWTELTIRYHLFANRCLVYMLCWSKYNIFSDLSTLFVTLRYKKTTDLFSVTTEDNN